MKQLNKYFIYIFLICFIIFGCVTTKYVKDLKGNNIAIPNLSKYKLSCKERTQFMKELRAMNITAMQLFPSIESVCKKVTNDIALLTPMGETKTESNKKILADLLLELRNTIDKSK